MSAEVSRVCQLSKAVPLIIVQSWSWGSQIADKEKYAFRSIVLYHGHTLDDNERLVTNKFLLLFSTTMHLRRISEYTVCQKNPKTIADL